MINPGNFIYLDDESRIYSRPGEGRIALGQYSLENEGSIKEGEKMNISMENRVMGIIENRKNQ